MKNMNTRFKELRKLLCLTQTELAHELGTTCSYISRLESGEREISPRILHIISQRFDVNIQWLVNGTKPIFNHEGNLTNDIYNALLSMSDEQWKHIVQKVEETRNKNKEH